MLPMGLSEIPLHIRVDDSLRKDEYILVGASPKPDMIQVLSSKSPQDLMEFGVRLIELRDKEGPEAKLLGFKIEISNPETGEKVCQKIIF